MRSYFAVSVLCIALADGLLSQERLPQGYLYRGPLYASRPAIFVEPEGGAPLSFDDSSFSGDRIETNVRSRTVRTVPVSGITLRVAYGPTLNGMVSFRLSPRISALPGPESFTTIPPDQNWRLITFYARPSEEPSLFRFAPTPPMKIVFTLERIDGQNGFLVFDNPNATELLWEALGRPSFSQ
jgi:hypothetical protein